MKGPSPHLFSELRILKDLQERVFVSAHSKGVSVVSCASAHSEALTLAERSFGRDTPSGLASFIGCSTAHSKRVTDLALREERGRQTGPFVSSRGKRGR